MLYSWIKRLLSLIRRETGYETWQTLRARAQVFGDPSPQTPARTRAGTANLRTKILDLRGFDSKRTLKVEGCNSHVHRESNLQESLGQQILVGIILAGRLGVVAQDDRVWGRNVGSACRKRPRPGVYIYIYIYIYIYRGNNNNNSRCGPRCSART